MIESNAKKEAYREVLDKLAETEGEKP